MTYYEFYNRLRAIGRIIDDECFRGVAHSGIEIFDDAISTEEVRDDLRPILEALDALALDVVGEQVPQLAWNKNVAREGDCSYLVLKIGNSWKARCFLPYPEKPREDPAEYLTAEAAKAACQAHYEANQ